MDLSYENNKGLYSFFLALMVMLAVLLPASSSYAEYAPSAPSAPFKAINVKFKTFGSVSNNLAFGFPNNIVEMSSTANARKMVSVRVYNVTKQKDYSSDFVIDYDNAWQARFDFKNATDNTTRFSNGDEVQVTYMFSELMQPETFRLINYSNNKSEYMISSSFLKTAPPVDVKVPVVAQEAKELPTVLGKVAGILIFLGSTILGILLAVGLVRRLLSSFLP